MDEMRDRILAAARRYKAPAAEFLRELIAIPSESRNEEAMALAVRKKMLEIGYPSAEVDRFGNVVGRVGEGRTVLVFDAHLDTRSVGDRSSWRFDPYVGDVKAAKVYGHGAANNKGGLAAIVYAGALIKELELATDCSIFVVGSIQAEECEGLAYKALFDVERLHPHFVVLSAPTGMRICRGQRGRIELRVTLRGHAVRSADPGKAFNCIYGMSRIIANIEALNSQLASHEFLGQATIAVTHVECDYNGPTALPESCSIIVDRRLIPGESDKKVLSQMRGLCKGTRAKVEVVEYDLPSYRNLRLPMEKNFPTWQLQPKHPLVRAAEGAFQSVFKKKAAVDRWTMSTAGVYTQGVFEVPTIGFGPSEEANATPANDHCRIDDLEKCMAFYASLLSFLPDTEPVPRRRRR
jgi:putative selenium metabolism hydrolase